MPDRHEKLSQALGLILSLSGSRVGLTLRELMAEHGLNLRTLQRMMKAIDQACGTLEAVESDEREKRWRMRTTPVTRAIAVKAEEIAEVEAAAKRLAEEGLDERAATLRLAADRLRAMTTEAALRRAEPDVEAMLAAEGVAARPVPRIRLQDGIIFELRRAILGSRRIHLGYRPAGGRARSYLLEPYGLLYGRRPYLLALRPNKPDVAVWRLDRIESVTDAGEAFPPRDGFELATLTADCFGIWREPPFDVALRFIPSAAADARAWQFHASQSLHDEPDGSLRVEFRAGGMEEMVAHLAAWGSAVSVLAPAALREKLAELGQQLLVRHSAPFHTSQAG